VIAGQGGTELGWVRINNDPKALVREARKAGGRGCPIAVEATYGWYLAVRAVGRDVRSSPKFTWRTRTG